MVTEENPYSSSVWNAWLVTGSSRDLQLNKNLVGAWPIPLKNMSSSVWKIKTAPNHQPEMDMEDSLTIPDLQKGTWRVFIAQGCYPSSPATQIWPRYSLSWNFDIFFLPWAARNVNPEGHPTTSRRVPYRISLKRQESGWISEQLATTKNPKTHGSNYWGLGTRSAMDLSSRELHHAADSHF